MTIQHFLDLDKVAKADLRTIIDNAIALKNTPPAAKDTLPLAGKFIACIFEKPSTRTRVSFDVGMKQLGGEVVLMTPSETQLGRNESIADTARVLSRYVDLIMIRTDQEHKLLELAEAATVPVINGLTDRTHPCQLMADIMTCEEHKGAIAGKKIAWLGDGNNMASSWIQAAVQFDFSLSIGCPDALRPPQAMLAWAEAMGRKIEVTDNPMKAVEGADFVNTDVWVSMSDEKPETSAAEEARHNQLKPFQVNDQIMDTAGADALFMHCLPAHRGEEVTASVIDGDKSIVWDEAENRLHAQKAIMLWCLGKL